MSKFKLISRAMRCSGRGKKMSALRYLVLLAVCALSAMAFVSDRALTATTTVTRSRTVTPSAPVTTWDGEMRTGNWVAVDYNRNDPNTSPCAQDVQLPDQAGGLPAQDGGLPDHYCDDTVLHVNVDPTFWKTHVGGVRVKIDRYRPNGLSDFDLYAYRSDAEGHIVYSNDANGNWRAELVTHGGLSHIGSAEAISIPKASGYYLIRVVYWAVTQSQFSGSAELVVSEPRTPAQQQPLGRQYSLPSVSGGARPGPAVLYADTPYVPQLANHNSRFNAAPLLVSGAEAYVKGEYLYQDYLYDDHGSDTDNGGAGPCINDNEYVGNLTYPTDRANAPHDSARARYGYNAADLVEFRIAVAPNSVAYRITLNTLLQKDSTIVAIAFDTDGDSTARRLPRDPGVVFPGPDEVITTWGTRAEHSRWDKDSGVWVTTPLATPDTPDANLLETNLEANQITVVVPRNISNPNGVWRATVAVGLYDPNAAATVPGLSPGGWLRPVKFDYVNDPGSIDPATRTTRATLSRPGGAGNSDKEPAGIFNLAFRFNEPVTLCDQPPDTNQAIALKEKNLKGYAHEIDFDALTAGSQSDTDGDGNADTADNCPSIPRSLGDTCRTAVPTHGTQVRILASRMFEVCDDAPEMCEGRDDSPDARTWTEFPGYRGRLEPYSLYIPLRYAQGTPAGLTLWLHGANALYFQGTGTALFQQFGEMRDNFVARPFGRGGNNWSRNEGEYDFFEVWNDVAAHFTLDPNSAALTGSSEGAYGVYRYGTLYPDLFGSAVSWAAVPGEGAWMPPAPPSGMEQTGGLVPRTGDGATLTNLYLENVRNLPYMNVVQATDELIWYTTVRAQNLGAPEFGIKGFKDYGYRFRFRTIEVAQHSALFQTDIPGATEFLGAARVDRNPPHVTFAYVPAADEPDRDTSDATVQAQVERRGLKHDHAYWVSDLTLADLNRAPDYGNPSVGQLYPAKGIIDAFSHGFGRGDPRPNDLMVTQCIPSSTPAPDVSPTPPVPDVSPTPSVALDCGTRTYTQVERTWGDAPAIPKENRLDLKLSNLRSATIDLRRASIDTCQPIMLVVKGNDSASDITLGGLFNATVDGDTLPVNDKGVVVHLRETQSPAPEYQVTIIPVCALPDLQVTNVTASNNRAREGEKVTITATIANTGAIPAGASQTEFLLDGATVLGTVDAPAIPAGGTATVSMQWRTAGVRGEHIIRVGADKTNTVAEGNETNSAATLTVNVKGNKVSNGSFEQSNPSGTGPAGWSGSNTSAGNAFWSALGSDGARSVSISGNGGNALLAGAPRWTSDSIAVTPGEVLSLVVSARSDGASSPATVGLVYLGASGNVLGTSTMLSVPRTTGGFAPLAQLITIPAGVAQVRVVLAGFAPTDAATAGTVTFDEVGLFGN